MLLWLKTQLAGNAIALGFYTSILDVLNEAVEIIKLVSSAVILFLKKVA